MRRYFGPIECQSAVKALRQAIESRLKSPIIGQCRNELSTYRHRADDGFGGSDRMFRPSFDRNDKLGGIGDR